MKKLLHLLTQFFLLILSIAVFSLGALLIFIERKTFYAVEEVKGWTPGTCSVLYAKAGNDNDFTIRCQYTLNGQTYLVKNETPSWNPYYETVSTIEGGVSVTLRDTQKNMHFYEFRQGADAKMWYEPSNPANSVLIPYASYLRPFLYIGIGYYVLLFGLAWYARRFVKKQ